MKCRGCKARLTERDISEWKGFCAKCCESGRLFDDNVDPPIQSKRLKSKDKHERNKSGKRSHFSAI